MENQLINFNYGVAQIRTLQKGEDIWFVAKDICAVLDLKWNGSKSIRSIPEEWRVVDNLSTTLKNQHGTQGQQEKDLIFINESAVYKLAFRSNKAEADRFANWVAGEVLPNIRKYGKYEVRRSIEDDRKLVSFPNTIANLSYSFKWQMEGEVSYSDRLHLLVQYHALLAGQYNFLEMFLQTAFESEKARGALTQPVYYNSKINGT